MSNQKRKMIPVSFHNSPVEPVQFFQIWLLPSRQGYGPSNAHQRMADAPSNTLAPAGSPGGGEKPIKINQEVELFVGKLASERTINFPLGPPHHTLIQLIEGDLEINGEKLSSGETVSVEDEKEVCLACEKGAHFLLYDLF
jgi:hypothetical protein